MKPLKGQVPVPILIGTAVTILMTALGSFSASINHTDAQVDQLKQMDSLQLQRVSTLEERTINTQKDIEEIKRDVKEVLRAIQNE